MTSQTINTAPFCEALVASLIEQRSTLPQAGQRSLCDVIVRCGGIATQAHGSVLASVSKYFEKAMADRKVASIASSTLVTLDVTKIFRGIESLFPVVIDSLYTGILITSPDQVTENLLTSAYNSLELKLPFFKPKLTPRPSVLLTSDVMMNDGNVGGDGHPLKSVNGDEFVATAGQPVDNINKEDNLTMDLSICSKCNLLFVSKEEFLAHTKANCARKLTCYSCGKMYTRVQSLVNHLVEVRHGETVCSICGHVGESQHDAELHIAHHAADMERPYFCTQCDIRFSTRKKWEKHMPKHSAEAPFVCNTCGKAFKWKHALTAHSVIHSTEKKFLCQECGFSTSHVSTFRFHSRIHSGNLMKCDVTNCTFQTTRKSNLVQHRLTHSKEKPHQCEVCGQSFSLAKNMRRHARQHDTSATVYKCKVNSCIFKSLRSDKYLEHVKKYHPDEEEAQQHQKSKQPLQSPQLPPPPQVDQISNSTNDVVLSSSAANANDGDKDFVKPDDAIEVEVDAGDADEDEEEDVEAEEGQAAVVTKKNLPAVVLTASPFNTVSPPNKTVSDTYESTFNNFDEQLIGLGTGDHDEDDISRLVSLPI